MAWFFSAGRFGERLDEAELGEVGQTGARADQVGPALERAFASGTVALVEAMTAVDFPESGSPAVGWWDVPIPAHMKEKRADYDAAVKEERL